MGGLRFGPRPVRVRGRGWELNCSFTESVRSRCCLFVCGPFLKMMRIAALRRVPLLRTPEPIAHRCASTVSVNDFTRISVDIADDGFKTTVLAEDCLAETAIFAFSGPIHRQRGPMTLQCGALTHMGAASPDEPWLFMNHSFSPSVRLAQQRTAEGVVVITVHALTDMVTGTTITFDYSLHEWETLDGGFVCHETGRTVTGWVGRTDDEKDQLLSSAAPHIRSLHLQHLFGSQSRC